MQGRRSNRLRAGFHGNGFTCGHSSRHQWASKMRARGAGSMPPRKYCLTYMLLRLPLTRSKSPTAFVSLDYILNCVWLTLDCQVQRGSSTTENASSAPSLTWSRLATQPLPTIEASGSLAGTANSNHSSSRVCTTKQHKAATADTFPVLNHGYKEQMTVREQDDAMDAFMRAELLIQEEMYATVHCYILAIALISF